MAIQTELGPLLWETGAAPRPKKVGMSLLILGMTAMGVWLANLFLSNFLERPDWFKRADFWIGMTFVSLFIGPAALLTYLTFFRDPSIGVRFFQYAVEFGTMTDRRTVRYVDLEYFHFVPTPKSSSEDPVKVMQFILDVATLSPAALFHAFNTKSDDPFTGTIVLKARNEKAMKIPVKKEVEQRLAGVVNQFSAGVW